MRAPTHGSLFTGILGFEQGFGEHFETRWCAEVDKFCNRIIALRAPGVPNLGDVTGIQRLDPVDVVSFGSPCQDLSVAGRRAGLDGARSGLFFEAARIINQCRPSFCVWENVPGAFSSESGRDFWMVLYTLRELGAHDVAWRVFDSQYAGVPQQRRRIYLVADFRGRRAGEILFDPEGCGGHPAPFGAEGQGVAACLTRGSSRAGVNAPGRRAEDCPQPSGRSTARFYATGGFRFDLDHDTYVMQERAVSENIDAGPGGKGYRQGPAYTLEARHRPQYVAKRRGGFGWSEREDGVSPTLESTGGSHQGGSELTPFVIQDAREGVEAKGQNGVGARRSDTAYTLDTLATQAVAITGQRMSALTSEGADASEDGTGRGTPIVLTRRGRLDATADEARTDGRTNALRTPGGGSSQPLVFDPRQVTSKTNRGQGIRDRSGTLNGAGLMSDAHQSTIRRFTPLECERLQGFPDGWTCLCLPLEAWAEDPGAAMFACKCPDGPRYRALGNAVTATVPRWLASRIAACL